MNYPSDLSYGPNTRIVLFGTSYCVNDEENLPQIKQVKQNILRLARIFVDPDIVGLPTDSIVTILDKEHTSEVTALIAAAAREASDTLIIYYTGHGMYGDHLSPLYLPVTTSINRDKAYTSIPITLIKSAMATSPARKRILILDCCYSGNAFEGEMSGRNDADIIDPVIDVEGTCGIAAAPPGLKAYAPPNESLTRFSGALINVLEHGIERDQPHLTLSDVFNEVQSIINRKADAPLPRKKNWINAESFIFVRNRSLKRPGEGLILNAIEGLRETVSATGSRLEALEARSFLFDELSAKLNTIESKIESSEKSDVKSNFLRNLLSNNGPWTQFGISKKLWNGLPFVPHKKLFIQYANINRNSFYLSVFYLILLFACFVMLTSGQKSFYKWGFLLSMTISYFGTLCLALSFSRSKNIGGIYNLYGFYQIKDEVKYLEPPVALEWQHEIKHNAKLNEILDDKIIDLFGFYFLKKPFIIISLLATFVALISTIANKDYFWDFIYTSQVP